MERKHKNSRIDLPITVEEMTELYVNQKLTDGQIAELKGHTVKQVRRHRHRLGIETVPRWSRNEVPPIEGRLRSLLIGSMLGDGGMLKPVHVPHFYESHHEPQMEYTDWKAEIWGSWISNVQTYRENHYKYSDGKEHFYRRLTTVSHEDLTPWFEMFYDTDQGGGHKNRNFKVYDRTPVDDVDAFALAVWYMDDGNANHTASFASGANKTPNGISRLMEVFEKFGLYPTFKLKESGESGRFELSANDTEIFAEIVRPHMIPLMSHKLDFGCFGEKSRLIRERKSFYPELLDLAIGGADYDFLSNKFEIPRAKVYHHLRHAYAQVKGMDYSDVTMEMLWNDDEVLKDFKPKPKKSSIVPVADVETANCSEGVNLGASFRILNACEYDFLDVIMGHDFPLDPKLPTTEVVKVLKYNAESSRAGVRFCSAYFPNRFHAKWCNATKTAPQAWRDGTTLRRLFRNSKPPFDIMELRDRVAAWFSTPTIFRPVLAKNIIKTYCVEGGTVWDPCSGYGGRLLGAWAAGAKYVGTDVDPETVEGNNAISKDIGYDGIVHLCPAEEFDVPDCDLVFTSPPYFNREMYSSQESQSYIRYPEFSTWLTGFWEPVLIKSFKALRQGGHAVFNIADPSDGSVPLVESTKRIALQLGFTLVETGSVPLHGMNRTKKNYEEPLLVFCKPLDQSEI